ncbi:MAG: 3'-5' exonuclease [Anaerolineales bacterium]
MSALERPDAATASSEMAAYVSVDIEAAGPFPAHYSMLSIGACLVQDLDRQFYVEIKPEHPRADPESLAVSGLSMEALAANGIELPQAMTRFSAWLEQAVGPDLSPIFVAFNAPFDWAYVNDAFHRTIGHNPFGHAALDIKAYFMGLTGRVWSETSFKRVADLYMQEPSLAHHALQDAVDQARIFRHMLEVSDRAADHHDQPADSTTSRET